MAALGFFESSSDPSQPDSYETIQRKRKLVEAMMKQGMDTSPVQHWTQGLARLANAGVGAWKESELDKQEKDSSSLGTQKILDALTGGGGSSSSAPAPAPMGVNYASDGQPSPVPPASIPGNYRDAIASIESKGSGDYAATGPVTGKGDRAFGRYQVMGANIPEWTQAALGRRMTPQEFLASPEAQDKVFDHRFGSYVQKYGNPQDAASAWFTGRPMAQGANARDVLGTSGSSYVDKFTRALGQGEPSAPQAIAQAAPTQVASNAPGLGYAPDSVPQQPTPQATPQAQPDPTLAATAARAANPQPGDQLLQLGPNGQLPPGAEKLLGALEGSPEARAMASPATGPQGQGSPVDKSKMLLMMAMDPRFSPQQRQMAMHVATTMQKDAPTWGKIGTDAMGREQMGWINPRTQKITPGPQMNGADSGGMVTVQGPNGPMQVPAAVAKQVQEALGKKMGGDLVGPDPEAAGKIRTEVQGLPGYKNLAQAAPIYQSMLKTAGTNSKASDLNLVYGLGKIFDPGSVVREGEMIMVKNTASLPDWLVGAANSLNGGQALTPETRKAILAEAHNRVTAYQDQFANDADHYRGIASRQKMNVEDIINPNLMKPFEPWKPTGATSANPLAEARDAIAKGAPRDAVIRRMREQGIPTEGL